MIERVTVSHRIHRARDQYVAALEQQTLALAELPTDLDPMGRLIAVDRILRDCGTALAALAEQVPGREQSAELDPELSNAIEEFRDSIDTVRRSVTPRRMPILAGLAELRPGRN